MEGKNRSPGLLVPFEPEDLEEFKTWLIPEEIHRNLYMLYYPMSLSSIQNWYEKEKANNAHIFKYADNGIAMTGIGLVHNIHPKNRCAEISLIVNPKHHGKGYSLIIGKALLRFSFDTLNLRKIICHTGEFNKAIIANAENMNSTREGVYREEFYSGGKYYDIYRYALFEHEYRNLQI
ncbi:MAG: GNAT family N-acetyltransferase [bacterium]|nr:GNAT family N-acetyltransferase [bacterium]